MARVTKVPAIHYRDHYGRASTVGIRYVGTACGKFGLDLQHTKDKDKVTCKTCRRVIRLDPP